MDRTHELAIGARRIRQPAVTLGWEEIATAKLGTAIFTRITQRRASAVVAVLLIHQSREVKLVDLFFGRLCYNRRDRKK